MQVQTIKSIPGITVKMVGGLGNQLFILAAGLEQARRLDCPLYIDVSDYDDLNDRNFELESLNLPNVFVIHENEDRTFSKLNQLVNKFKPKKSSYFFSDKYDPNINNIEVGAKLFGYFQLPEYCETSSAEIVDALPSTDLNNTINVHMRRGDYLLPNNASGFGLLSDEYFERAIIHLQNISGIKEICIYSDSPEKVTNFADKWNASIKDPSFQLSALDTLINLSSSKNLILSNSSLSWWAARIASLRNSDSTIIAPDPWFKGASSDAGKIPIEDWLEFPAIYS